MTQSSVTLHLPVNVSHTIQHLKCVTMVFEAITHVCFNSTSNTAIVCDELETLENGVIEYAPDSTGPEYDLNTLATYICDEGFELVGDETRTCEDVRAGVSGEFSGTAATCEREYYTWM